MTFSPAFAKNLFFLSLFKLVRRFSAINAKIPHFKTRGIGK